MATFEVREREGMRFVEIEMNHEVVRAEAGALAHLTGDVEMHSRVFTAPGAMLRSLLAQEAVYRPTFFGTGVLTLESSLGGYHRLELRGETWILERGAYWASEGDVEVGFRKERFLTGLLAGEGPVYLQTLVRGEGTVMLTTRGPVEERTLRAGERLAVQGRSVLARTGSVRLRARRATKNFLGRFTAGEGRMRVYEGPGVVLHSPTEYWRYRMLAAGREDATLI